MELQTSTQTARPPPGGAIALARDRDRSGSTRWQWYSCSAKTEPAGLESDHQRATRGPPAPLGYWLPSNSDARGSCFYPPQGLPGYFWQNRLLHKEWLQESQNCPTFKLGEFKMVHGMPPRRGV